MRFLGFDLGGPTPDENTIRLYRDKLTESGALKRVMKAFDWQLRKKGYIPLPAIAGNRLPGNAWPDRSSNPSGTRNSCSTVPSG